VTDVGAVVTGPVVAFGWTAVLAADVALLIAVDAAVRVAVAVETADCTAVGAALGWVAGAVETTVAALDSLAVEAAAPPQALSKVAPAPASKREILTGKVEIPRTYDADHLRAIHRHLFGNVYEWAGEYRSVNMGKPGAPAAFAHTSAISTYLEDAHSAVKRTDWRSLDRDGFAERASAGPRTSTATSRASSSSSWCSRKNPDSPSPAMIASSSSRRPSASPRNRCPDG